MSRPGTDIADTLTGLVADVEAAVESYLGLSISMTTSGSPVDFTVLNESTRPEHITTSLLIPLSDDVVGEPAVSGRASVVLILFAGVPGAFTDLAADLSWITGRPLPEFVVDEHRDLPSGYAGTASLRTMWIVDQALGVLLSRGSTFGQAERELHKRAASAGIEVAEAAELILAGLTPPEQKPGGSPSAIARNPARGCANHLSKETS